MQGFPGRTGRTPPGAITRGWNCSKMPGNTSTSTNTFGGIHTAYSGTSKHSEKTGMRSYPTDSYALHQRMKTVTESSTDFLTAGRNGTTAVDAPDCQPFPEGNARRTQPPQPAGAGKSRRTNRQRWRCPHKLVRPYSSSILPRAIQRYRPFASFPFKRPHLPTTFVTFTRSPTLAEPILFAVTLPAERRAAFFFTLPRNWYPFFK